MATKTKLKPVAKKAAKRKAALKAVGEQADKVLDHVAGAGKLITDLMKGGKLNDIPLSELTFTPDNPRAIDQKAPEFTSLVDNVRANGILEPILVRPLPNGKFEVRAGERRARATRIAGHQTIRAIVAEMDDQTALRVTMVENMDRQDLRPMEESNQVRLAIQRGFSPDDVAQILGRTRAWVAQRSSLANLASCWSSQGVAGKPLEHWTAAHWAIIARMPADFQESLWKSKAAPNSKGRPQSYAVERLVRMTTDELRDSCMVEANTLKGVPWDIADATLVPTAGSCTECPKQSDKQRDLFAKNEASRCLDQACFHAKAMAHVKVALAAFEEEHGANNIRLIGRETQYRQPKNPLTKDARFLPDYQCDVSAKKKPGYEPALIVTGNLAGKVCFVKVHSWASESRKNRTAKQKPAEIVKRKREDAVKKLGKRWSILSDCFRESDLPLAAVVSDPAEALRLLVAVLVDNCVVSIDTEAGSDIAKLFDGQEPENLGGLALADSMRGLPAHRVLQIAWKAVLYIHDLKHEFLLDGLLRGEPSHGAQCLARILDVDLARLQAEVIDSIQAPEPNNPVAKKKPAEPPKKKPKSKKKAKPAAVKNVAAAKNSKRPGRCDKCGKTATQGRHSPGEPYEERCERCAAAEGW